MDTTVEQKIRVVGGCHGHTVRYTALAGLPVVNVEEYSRAVNHHVLVVSVANKLTREWHATDDKTSTEQVTTSTKQ